MKVLIKALKYIIAALLVLIIIVVMGSGIIYLQSSGQYTMSKTLAQDKSIPHVKIGDYLFHSEAFGDRNNPVIIVLHGGPGNDYRMLLPLKALSDEYYVAFYDQRGAGLSPRVDGTELTLNSYLDDLNSIIQHYAGERQVIIVAHSWGAMLAVAYIAQYPDRASKVVLGEPGFLTNEALKEFFDKVMKIPSAGFLFHYYKSWIKSLHVTEPDEYAANDFFYTEAIIRYQNKDNPMATYYCNNEAPAHALQDWRFGGHASEAAREMAIDEDGSPAINLASGIENYKNKILLLTGQCNQAIGTEFQKKYHVGLFSDIELKEIENSGHAMFGEQPEVTIKIIRDYLNEE